jgi:DNA-binding IclR family transcriptional regulator
MCRSPSWAGSGRDCRCTPPASARITAYTVTQPARLLEQLRRVRAEGYATTGEEMSLGACSVAVPVRNGDTVVAALGMVVPDLRRQLPRLVSALQVAAHGISRTLASPASVQWK